MSAGSRPWYERAFDREYLDVYAHRDERDADRAIEFLKRESIVRQGDLVLDLACGNGRHSETLARSGYRICGLDLSMDLLRDFRARSGGPIPVVRGDMRHLPLGRRFDAVLSLFTSFGYFESDDENWRVLREVAGVLQPGGRFLLDYLNAARVRATLVPTSEQHLDGDVKVFERRNIDEERGRVVKAITITRGSQMERQWEESVRLYTPSQIQSALEAVGFQVSEVFGDFDGSSHRDTSPRLIVLSQMSR